MKKLITGGRGLIGTEFDSGIRSTRQDCDLLDSQQTLRYFESISADHVIHTAARVGGVAANTTYVYDFFLDNIRINSNVIDAAMKSGVKKLIAFTSTCVMPDNVVYPLREQYLHNGPPHQSNFGYAYAKRMVDVQIQACNQQHGTQYFTVIPTNVYGPHDNYDLENGHVLPSLIHRCYLAKLHDLDFEVWGSGSPLREFIFSRDLAKICDILLEKHQTVDPVMISNSYEYSIRQVVDMICGILNFRGKVKWNTEKPEGQFRKPTDTSRLQSIIGNFQFVSLDDGLEETIDYFVTNFDSVRK